MRIDTRNRSYRKVAVVAVALCAVAACGRKALPYGKVEAAPHLVVSDQTPLLCWCTAAQTSTVTLAPGSPPADPLWSKTVRPKEDGCYAVPLSGVRSGKTYTYTVAAGDRTWRHAFTHWPAEGQPTAFFVYGDTRTNGADHELVAGAMVDHKSRLAAKPWSFVLHVGDLVEFGDRPDSWRTEWFSPQWKSIQLLFAQLPIIAVRGNHEQSGVLFHRLFPHPVTARSHHWSVDIGVVHVAVLDATTDYAPDSPQLRWLENDLGATAQPWKIIAVHEPGYHASSTHTPNAVTAGPVARLARDNGVAAIVAGHVHNYARKKVDGVFHVVLGGGGAPLYDIDRADAVDVAAKVLHYGVVEATTTQFRFFAVSADGRIIDSFALSAPAP